MIKMHEAYEVIPVVQKLPSGLFIETLAAYDDYLLVGTKSGNLLLYSLSSTPQGNAKGGSSKCDIKLLHSNKAFSKKNIAQIEVVPDVNMMICLADSIVSVFDLSQGNLNSVTTISKTKGAHLFTVNSQKHKTITGEVVHSIRLCVAIRKKLQLYYWKPREKKFLELTEDMSLCDIPRTIVWCCESLCLGFKSEYSIMKMTGEPKDLFPTGIKQQDPLITLINDDSLALGNDEQTILIDSEGYPTLKYSIKWSEVPSTIGYDAPYLVAALSSSIEIRSIEPRLHVQSIDLSDIKVIAPSRKGWIFLASISDVWLLRAVNFPEQITKLLAQNHFELALRMAKMTNESETENKQLMQRIENLYAFHLFCKRDFKSAMDVFFKLETDPSHVIGLFPDLLPEVYRNSLEYPDKLPTLQGTELESGLFALNEYLIQVRHRLMHDLGNNVSSITAITEGSKTIHFKKQLLQIIDTTLLKCYLQINDALVASLLRVKDNYCLIEESERALKKYQKYSELIILYNRKGLHRKALELLFRQAKKPDSPLKGHERTVQYLQHLGKDHLDLILEFSRWVLKEHPEDGLKIFTEDLMESENLPRNEVLKYLCDVEPDLVIPYLEHVIYIWRDETKSFHNTLVRKYCEKIRTLYQEYRKALPEGEPPAAAGKEPGELGQLRTKLLDFLEQSQNYTVESFALHMLNDGLFEEGAIVLGKLGRHEEALTIYAHALQNPDKAETYCLKNYNKDKPGDQDVFLLLLKLYLAPSELNIFTPGIYSVPNPRPNLQKALEILSKYSAYLDPFKAIELLPTSVSVCSIRDFLQQVLHSTQAQKHSIQLLKSLLFAENLQVRAQRVHHQSFKFLITDLDMCRVCQKRIGKSAFAHFPTGVTVHYSCKDQYAES